MGQIIQLSPFFYLRRSRYTSLFFDHMQGREVKKEEKVSYITSEMQ